jgi:hypothetical protein
MEYAMIYMLEVQIITYLYTHSPYDPSSLQAVCMRERIDYTRIYMPNVQFVTYL